MDRARSCQYFALKISISALVHTPLLTRHHNNLPPQPTKSIDNMFRALASTLPSDREENGFASSPKPTHHTRPSATATSSTLGCDTPTSGETFGGADGFGTLHGLGTTAPSSSGTFGRAGSFGSPLPAGQLGNFGHATPKLNVNNSFRPQSTNGPFGGNTFGGYCGTPVVQSFIPWQLPTKNDSTKPERSAEKTAKSISNAQRVAEENALE